MALEIIVHSPDGSMIEVLKNPTLSEVRASGKRYSRENPRASGFVGLGVRALLSPRGAIYAWDAAILTHNALREYMQGKREPWGSNPVYLETNPSTKRGLAMMAKDTDASRKRAIQLLKNYHKKISRVLGANVFDVWGGTKRDVVKLGPSSVRERIREIEAGGPVLERRRAPVEIMYHGSTTRK